MESPLIVVLENESPSIIRSKEGPKFMKNHFIHARVGSDSVEDGSKDEHMLEFNQKPIIHDQS